VSDAPLPPSWQLREIAHRVAPMLSPPPERPRRRSPIPAWPELSLIVETVATHGEAGPARFGSYQLCRGASVLARGLFVGPSASAADVAELARISRRRRLDELLTLDGFLRLIYRYSYKPRLPVVGWQLPAHFARLAADWAAPPVGSRYAGGVSLIVWTKPSPVELPRGQRRLRNGRVRNGHRPAVVCKQLANGSVLLAYTGRGEPDRDDRIPEGEGAYRRGYRFEAHLLPLERLCYGLTGSRHRTLASACTALGLDSTPIHPETGDLAEQAAHCLERLDTVHRLYLALLERHRQQQLPLPPDQVYSPASSAKSLLDAIGVSPPLHRYRGELAGIGAAACAAYGGWSGVGVRSQPGSPPLPVRLLDVAGMYPVCAHALAIWPLLCARHLDLLPVDADEITHWIAEQTPDTVTLSPELRILCRLQSDQDVLVQRIRPGQTWLTTVAPLTCDTSLWWPLPDLLISYFETGRVPKVDACLRLVGEGCITGLQPVDLPGLGRFDPSHPGADLFLFLAEGRRRLEAGYGELAPLERERLIGLYKLWDNSACSGIFLEVHPEEPRNRPRRGTVIGPDGPYQTEATAFEQPGRWFFPPFYSLVTGAARLLLYLAKREATEAGGTVAYWDTDSVAIVATHDGGPLPFPSGALRDARGTSCVTALSHADVEAIRWRLERHSPYHPTDRGSSGTGENRAASSGDAVGPAHQQVESSQPTLFQLEPETFAGRHTTTGETYFYAVASKRKTCHTIDNDGRKLAVAPSEFALGHHTDPTGRNSKGWINDAWNWAALNGEAQDWLADPVLAEVSINRHADLTRLGDDLRPWDRLIVAQADRQLGRTSDGTLPRPVTPYRPNLDSLAAAWRDYATGRPLPPARLFGAIPDERSLRASRPLYLRSFRSLLAAHIRAPELKALSADGTPCRAGTAGPLHPAPTIAYATVAIGREANYSDDAGVLREPDYTSYPNATHDQVADNALAVLRQHVRQADGHREIARALQLSDRGVRRYLQTGRISSTRKALAITYAASLAEEAFNRTYPNASLRPRQPQALLYLATRDPGIFRAHCGGCGQELIGRQTRWCAHCRQRPRARRRRDDVPT
jgi:hypothetical protein